MTPCESSVPKKIYVKPELTKYQQLREVTMCCAGRGNCSTCQEPPPCK